MENERIAYRDYKVLKERCDFVQLTELNGYFTELRDVKEEQELFCIEKACRIACCSLHEVLDFIRPGTAESEIAAELEYRMRKNGASGKSFETIVASGKRSAMPHGVASDKKIENGDAVTIDFGCIYKHYCSDMTRTFFVGQPDAELERIYHIVYEAQIAAMEGYRFGMTRSGAGRYFPGNYCGKGIWLEFWTQPRPRGGNRNSRRRRNQPAEYRGNPERYGIQHRTGNLCRGPRRRADRGSCRCGRKRSSDPHGRF